LDRPPASLVVEGQLRPAFAVESTMVAKHISSIAAVIKNQPSCIQQMSAFHENLRFLQVSEFMTGDAPKEDKKESGATFFKVEVLSIELITASEACFFHVSF